jgi:hypothetical protein
VTQIARIPGLYIDLKRKADGGFEIAAQHLRDGGEYEYWLTVAPEDVVAFATALGTDPEGVIPAWDEQVQEIAVEGETTWLKRHGVPYGFFSWGSPTSNG